MDALNAAPAGTTRELDYWQVVSRLRHKNSTSVVVEICHVVQEVQTTLARKSWVPSQHEYMKFYVSRVGLESYGRVAALTVDRDLGLDHKTVPEGRALYDKALANLIISGEENNILEHRSNIPPRTVA